MPQRPEFGAFVRRLTDPLNRNEVAKAAGLTPSAMVRARDGHVGLPRTVAALADGLRLEGEPRAEFFRLAEVADPGPQKVKMQGPGVALPETLSKNVLFLVRLHEAHIHTLGECWWYRLDRLTPEYNAQLSREVWQLADDLLREGYPVPVYADLVEAITCKTAEDAKRDVALLGWLVRNVFPKDEEGPEP